MMTTLLRDTGRHTNRYATILSAMMIAALLFAAVPLRLAAQQFEKKQFYQTELAHRLKVAKAYEATVVTGAGIDVTYYKLDLRVVASPPTIHGTVTINATVTADTISMVSLDLTSKLNVDSVFVNGVRAVVTQQPPATLGISFPKTYTRGSALQIAVTYGGVPDTLNGSIAFRAAGGYPWIWTLSEPYGARDWWPSKDHPADKADSADIWVTVDSTLKAGSEGILDAVIDNGDGTKTYRWKHRYPISTYLISVAIAHYAEFSNWFKYSPTDSMQVLNYVLPTSLSLAQSQLPAAIRALQIYSSLYGLYPFSKEKYGHAQFGWGGGMEHQTMTSLVGFGEWMVVHELAHQWFGDMITMATWPHLWLNEGFATYNEALYNEMNYGAASYRGTIQWGMQIAKQAIGSIYLRDTSSMNTMFSYPLVYEKGSTVLHMLRGVLGDSLFFAGMKAYATDPRFRFKTATTEDFRSVMETVSGKNLGYFFDEWIYGEHYPQYAYSWRWDTTKGGTVTVSIHQTTGTTNPSFFTMPIQVRSYTGGTGATTTVFNNAAVQSFGISSAAAPDSVVLDPDGWILRDVQRVPSSVMEELLMPTEDELFSPYPNPFNPGTTLNVLVASTEQIRLDVFDLLGRNVETLTEGVYVRGLYPFYWNASRQSSGVYYAVLTTPTAQRIQKLLLIR